MGERGSSTSVASDPDERARQTEEQMTDDERFSLLRSLMVVVFGGGREPRVPADVPQCAGWVPGVERLGVPALLITDAGMGVTNPGGGRPGDTATALPAGIVLGSTFNRELARDGGVLVGREAVAKGFNVLCGGGMTLIRDLRNGRNFEYISEDPLLSGELAAESVIGNQQAGVVSMLKHLSMNCNETNKFWLDAIIDPAAHRESDMLAFEIAIHKAEPGSLMGAYNKINGEYCSGSSVMLDGMVKQAIGFKGWIMSDWKAVYGWEFARNGLDQHSGAQLDAQEWFGDPLRAAYARGELPAERLADMVRRILRSIYAVGIDEPKESAGVDVAAHHQSALETARQGIVLLANDGILPLDPVVKTLAVIGGHADLGVAAGGGSSLVIPPGGYSLDIPQGGSISLAALRHQAFLPSAPLAELRRLLPDATVVYDGGWYPAEAALVAGQADLAIVFATKLESEGFDNVDDTLPWGQDAVIAAVAAANPNTVVVLETGNPIAMPWAEDVRAIVQAWYPGQAGGQAIAEILTGAVNPSGRLPVTWPMQMTDAPRTEIPNVGKPFGTPSTVVYDEGSDVGYRWFAREGIAPRYPFGHGLSYTTFEYADLELTGGDTVTAVCTVTNTGDQAGAEVAQLYLTEVDGRPRQRLLDFQRVALDPGQSQRVSLVAEPRVLASYDGPDGCTGTWRIAQGSYSVAVARSATTPALTGEVALAGRTFGR